MNGQPLAALNGGPVFKYIDIAGSKRAYVGQG